MSWRTLASGRAFSVRFRSAVALAANLSAASLLALSGCNTSEACGQGDTSAPGEICPSNLGLANATLLTPSVVRMDLGTLPAGSRACRTFSLTNNGPSAVTIVQVATSCDCLRVRLEEAIVGPGETVQAEAIADYTDDPAFQGSLVLEATGHTKSSKPLAFAVQFDVTVGVPEPPRP